MKKQIQWRNFKSYSNSDLSESEDKENEESSPNCGNKICWWSPSTNLSLAEYCMDSSLHGLKYIGQPNRHLTERIFWGVVFSMAVATAAYLINTVYLRYNLNPVIVSFSPSETTIDHIPFPAITICNVNNILKSKANEYFRDAKGPKEHPKTKRALKNLYYLNNICSTVPSFSKKFNFSIDRESVDPELVFADSINKTNKAEYAEFFEESSQSCENMLKLCLWSGSIYNCNDLFSGIETDYGFCCTFNMVPQSLLYRLRNDKRDNIDVIKQWEKFQLGKDGLLIDNADETEEILTRPRRQHLPGKSSGLSVLLNPDLKEYFCASSDSIGFQNRGAISRSNGVVKIYNLAEPFRVGGLPNFCVLKKMRILKKINIHNAIEPPHLMDLGMAVAPNAEVFVDINPEITTANTNIMKFSLVDRNCYFEGELELHYFKYYSQSNCIDECIANKTFDICGCVRFFMPRDERQTLCGELNSSCVVKVQKLLLKEGTHRHCSMCRPSCTEIDYNPQTTFTPLRKDINIWKNDGGEDAEWSYENVSIVHFYYGSAGMYTKIRNELYGTTDLIANTGGLLGLCLGFSGISVIEIAYYLTLRAFCILRRQRITDNAERVTHRFRIFWDRITGKKTLVTHIDSFGKETLKDDEFKFWSTGYIHELR